MIPLLSLPYQNYEQSYLLVQYLINAEVESQVSNTAFYLKTMQFIRSHSTIVGYGQTEFPILFNLLLNKKEHIFIISKPRDTL